MSEMQTQVLPLEGMRALVTGGAQGIGAGICHGLATAGAAVSIEELRMRRLIPGDAALAVFLYGALAIAVVFPSALLYGGGWRNEDFLF